MKKLSILLLVILSLFSLVSCKETKKEKTPEKVALEYVYMTEKVKLPEDADLYSIFPSGDNIYFSGSKRTTATDEFGNEYTEYNDIVMVSDTTFENFKDFYTFKNENGWNEETGESYGSYINGYFPDNRGGLWLAFTEYSSKPVDDTREEWINENKTVLHHLDASGNETETIDISDILSLIPDLESDEKEAPYVAYMTEAENGNKYFALGQRIVVIDGSGNLVANTKLEQNENIMNNCAILENGNLRTVCYDWSSMEGTQVNVKELDIKTGELKTTASLKDIYDVILSAKGDIYYNDSYRLNSIDPYTGDETPVLDWINSDINCDRVNSPIFTDDGLFLFEWDTEYSNRSLLYLTPASDGDVVEKYVMTLATGTIDSNIKNMIIDYNRSTEDYRIQVKAYGWEEEATEKFDQDLLAGNIPDIICVDSLGIEKYAGKNFFADLGAMIDSDPDISRDSFLPNILKAAEINGKLYRLPVSFSARTLMGKTSVLNGQTSWTWDEFLALQKQYPGSQLIGEQDQNMIMDSFLPLILSDFVDYNSGKTSFSNGDFGKFLEFVKTLPKEINWDDYYADIDWEEYDKRYRNDKELLVTAYLSNFEGNSYYAELFGEPISLIGYPTSGDNGNAIMFASQFAIGEKSVFKDQAWDFLKMIFEEKYQKDFVWEFPVIKSVFEEKYQEQIEQINKEFEKENSGDNVNIGVDTDGDGVVDYFGDDIIVGGDSVVIKPREEVAATEDSAVWDIMIDTPVAPELDYYQMSKEERLAHAEAIYTIATTATNLTRFNDPVIDIIKTEVGAYLDSQKSLDETCKIIESRVGFYMAENF